MAAGDSSNAIDTDSNSNLHSEGDDATSNDSSKALTIPAPAVCLVRFAGDAAGGALMGSIFGYGALLLSLPFFYASFTLLLLYSVWKIISLSAVFCESEPRFISGKMGSSLF